tara:strand:+ start:2376 stop:2870 length:495 start_codon:yes stop_codon:yes gene_type:complete
MEIMRKKGSIQDMVFIPIVILVLGIVSIAAFMAMSKINDQMQSMDSLSGTTKHIMDQNTKNMPGTFDAVFALSMFLLTLMAIISGFFIRTHPAFFLVSIFLLAMIAGANAILSNAFESFTNDSEIVTYSADFPMTTSLMGKYPIIILVLSILLAIFLYSRGGEI